MLFLSHVFSRAHISPPLLPSLLPTLSVPPTMQSSFSSLAANITEEVILSCEVVASDDGSNIQWVWRVNGSEVVTSGNVLYDRTGLVRKIFYLRKPRNQARLFFLIESLLL